MANFIGTAGDFLKEKAIKRRVNVLMGLFLLMTGFFFLLGFVAAKQSLLWLVLAAVIAIPTFKFFEKSFDKQLRISRLEEDGAIGEQVFLKYLTDLPDTYTVVSDLDFADSYGNIDHLIIGPTGLFAVDVKNWRGTITPDGKGELLLNGRPPRKPLVRHFTRRTMDLKERFKALTRLDPYIQCVFAFHRTHVAAKWGATASVHCIPADQIVSYIRKYRTKKPISPKDIAVLAKAAEALQTLAPSNDRPAAYRTEAAT